MAARVKTTGINGVTLAVLAGGIVILVSGLTNKHVSEVIRGFLKGSAPEAQIVADTGAATTPGEHSGAYSGYTHKDFFDAVLQGIGAPVTRSNELALASVAQLEGLNRRFNPLNSVVAYGGSTPFNTAGVQDYKTFNNGVNGTIQLLNGRYWDNVRTALQRDEGVTAVLAAFRAAYTWAPGVNFPTNELRLQQVLQTPVG